MSRQSALQITCLLMLQAAAHAALITSVSRAGGDGDWLDPYWVSMGLNDGALAFCDRQHVYTNIPVFLLGADYVVTEQDDKYAVNVQYSVSISPNAGDVYAFVWLDNRWTQPDPYGENPPYFPGWPTWLAAGGWTDTGLDIGIWERTGSGNVRYNSVFYKALHSGPGGASFQTGPAPMDFSNFYGIAVIPEPSTLALLGLAVCARVWRRRPR